MALKKRVNKDFDIIVGLSSTINGDLISDGSIRIDGKVTGDITSKGDVIIGDHAVVKSNITAEYCEISGNVEGSVHSETQLKIFKSGELNGDITVSSFTIEEGGIFSGNCDINPEKKERKVVKKDFNKDNKDKNDSKDKHNDQKNNDQKNNEQKNNKK
jgi:cytoskeletal protein CcmA (bactofilin family)